MADKSERTQVSTEDCSKLKGPADFWTNAQGHWLTPFRMVDAHEADLVSGLALPAGLGAGNDCHYLHQAAASLPPLQRLQTMAVFYAVDDLQECVRFLESFAQQQRDGLHIDLMLCAPILGKEVEACCAEIGVEAVIWPYEVLSDDIQAQILAQAAQVDLVAVFEGDLELDPTVLLRASRLTRASDLIVQPLYAMPQGQTPEHAECFTPYAVHTVEAGLAEGLRVAPFRRLTSLNMILPSALLLRMGGLRCDFDHSVTAAREWGFRAFVLGAYFSPLWVYAVPQAIGKDQISRRDQKRFMSLCPNEIDRKQDGIFDVPKVSLFISVAADDSDVLPVIDRVLAQDSADLEVCIKFEGEQAARARFCALLEREYKNQISVRLVSDISCVHGLYVGVLSTQVLLRSAAVELLVSYLDAHPDVSCCFGSAETIDAQESSLEITAQYGMMGLQDANGFFMCRRAALGRISQVPGLCATVAPYDLALRLGDAGKIARLDHVLYHRRRGSCSSEACINDGSHQPLETIAMRTAMGPVSCEGNNAHRQSLHRQSLQRRGLWPDWDMRMEDAAVKYMRRSGRPRVMFWPNYSRANPYQKLLYRSTMATYEVIAASIEDAVRILEHSPHQQDANIFHLHWLNFLFSGVSTRVEARLRIRRFLTRLSRFKALGGRVVWTIHNSLSHDNPYMSLERSLSKHLVEMVDIVHFHCAESVSEVRAVFPIPEYKIRIAPHGHYLGVYEDYISQAAARATLGIAADEDVVLFFGQVRPYKGVGQLVQAFRRILASRPKARLVIAGASHDDFWGGLEPRLNAAEQSRILRIDRFLDDSEMQVFFRAADFSVFPYRDILTSGSLLLSLSFATPAVVPYVAMTADVLEGHDAGFLYNPHTSDGLERALHLAFEAKDNNRLPGMGQRAYARALCCEWTCLAETVLNDAALS